MDDIILILTTLVGALPLILRILEVYRDINKARGAGRKKKRHHNEKEKQL